MALNVKKATLTAPAATGNQSYTGVGFQPKAIIFWWTMQTVEGIIGGAGFGVGFVSGPGITQGRLASWVADDNASPTNTAREYDRGIGTNAAAVHQVSAALGDLLQAELVSMDADGFTLNWVVTASGVIVHYVPLGGADLVNVKVQDFSANTATGNQSVTGVGFQPGVVLLLSGSRAASGAQAPAKVSIGAMQSTTKRWALALNARDAQTMTANVDAMSTQRTDSCFLSLTDTAAIDARADFVSMDADGFTVNWIDAPASAIFIAYLALKGGSFDVGAVAACTVNNCNNDVPVGFTPKGLLLSSGGKVASTAITAHAEGYVGAGDGTSEGTAGAAAADDALPTQTDSFTLTNKVIRTGDAEADHDLAAVANGFRLTWPAPPAVAEEVCYVAFGDVPPVPSDLATKLLLLPDPRRAPGMLLISGG